MQIFFLFFAFFLRIWGKSCNFVAHLRKMSSPHIIGILNITPDSFADSGKKRDTLSVVKQAVRMVEQGAYGLDIGAVATHPGAALVDEQEEWRRLSSILPAIRQALPHTPLSVDTYRSKIGRAHV